MPVSMVIGHAVQAATSLPPPPPPPQSSPRKSAQRVSAPARKLSTVEASTALYTLVLVTPQLQALPTLLPPRLLLAAVAAARLQGCSSEQAINGTLLCVVVKNSPALRMASVCSEFPPIRRAQPSCAGFGIRSLRHCSMPTYC